MTDLTVRPGVMPEPTTAEPCLPRHLLKPRLRRWEASEYLELAHGVVMAPATLAKMASLGGGPSYHKAGRAALYPTAELDRWATLRLGALRRHSSDPGLGEAV